MEQKEQETGITPFETVRPLVKPEEAARQWQEFEELKEALLNGSDYQKIGDKQYIKKSGFRKIAVYFGLSDRILEEEKITREDDSFYWRIKVEIEAPNGRKSEGVGICDSEERRFAHVEHDVYATAHTRAKNRAISDMVAGGVVSAEEMAPAKKQKKTHPKNKKVVTRQVDTKKKPKKTKEVESKQKVKEKEKKSDQDPPDYEDNIAMTLVANGLKVADYLEIQQYSKNVYVAPPKNIEEEDWVKYNSILSNIGAGWNKEDHRWEIPVK